MVFCLFVFALPGMEAELKGGVREGGWDADNNAEATEKSLFIEQILRENPRHTRPCFRCWGNRGKQN